MSPQQFESLFIVLAVLFIGVSFHAIRLWLKVQGLNRSSPFVVIQPVSTLHETDDGAGCLTTLLWIFLVVSLISVAITRA